MNSTHKGDSRIAIIGGGPAGLMAAETALMAGFRVSIYDAMPSVGRKFLVAGKGGLNLTHAEPFEDFLSRFGNRQNHLAPYLEEFGPSALRVWIKELGFETFVGSSGRVFPKKMKAGEILHAWRDRILSAGEDNIELFMGFEWLGWTEAGELYFATRDGEKQVMVDAVILAMGGASWPQLGSTGSWVEILQTMGVLIAPLKPSNCGFDVAWSEHFSEKFNGQPIKPVILSFIEESGKKYKRKGEFIVTADGVEGSLIYVYSAILRDTIESQSSVEVELDLAPDWSVTQLTQKLAQSRGSRSFSSHIKKTIGIKGVKMGLLWEFLSRDVIEDPEALAKAIKNLPLTLLRARPIDEAISTAGGVSFEDLNEHLMLKNNPGVFCAGEMLDWEAPTGGYLLTASIATGRAAALGAAAWLAEK